MPKTLIVLNPHAGGGKAGRVWSSVEPLLRNRVGDLMVARTEDPKQVVPLLDEACRQGVEQVISVGGDGTNHALINALVTRQQQGATAVPLYGNLPIGTGRDWARSRGIPFNVRAAVDWIAAAKPLPTDIGQIEFNVDEPRRYFLNIASTGLGGEVDARVNRVIERRPWTFLRATVDSILSYTPQHVQIEIDGAPWYDDRATLVVVANGTTFGHGMRIAPSAMIDDGLFDIVLIEAVSRTRLLTALWSVYRGTHLQLAGVRSTQARQVRMRSEEGSIGLDLDGEYAEAPQVTFEVRPGLLTMLA
jgi:YegS/Rv2252/BmrU family lipid kinase